MWQGTYSLSNEWQKLNGIEYYWDGGNVDDKENI